MYFGKWECLWELELQMVESQNINTYRYICNNHPHDHSFFILLFCRFAVTTFNNKYINKMSFSTTWYQLNSPRLYCFFCITSVEFLNELRRYQNRTWQHCRLLIGQRESLLFTASLLCAPDGDHCFIFYYFKIRDEWWYGLFGEGSLQSNISEECWVIEWDHATLRNKTL